MTVRERPLAVAIPRLGTGTVSQGTAERGKC